MKLDSGSWEFFGNPIQIDRDAGDAEDAGIVAENGYLIPPVCGDFTVDEEFFDTFSTAGKPDGITGLAVADEQIAHRHYCENSCGVDNLCCGGAGELYSWKSGFGNHFQQTIVAADGDTAGEIGPGRRVVGKNKGFQKPDMDGFRFPDAVSFQEVLQCTGSHGRGHGPELFNFRPVKLGQVG